jgi:hypothetical protein
VFIKGIPTLAWLSQVLDSTTAQRAEMLNRTKMVERERASLESAKVEAEAMQSASSVVISIIVHCTCVVQLRNARCSVSRA